MENLQLQKEMNNAIYAIKKHRAEIAKIEQRRDMFIAEYKSRIADAEKICADDCAEHNHIIEHLKYRLYEYAALNLPHGKKSIKFPEGTLKFSSQPLQYKFKNGEVPNKTSQQLIDYLQKNNPDFIQTMPTADWACFKKRLRFLEDCGDVIDKETGELIPDLTAEKPDDKFEVIT